MHAYEYLVGKIPVNNFQIKGLDVFSNFVQNFQTQMKTSQVQNKRHETDQLFHFSNFNFRLDLVLLGNLGNSLRWKVYIIIIVNSSSSSTDVSIDLFSQKIRIRH